MIDEKLEEFFKHGYEVTQELLNKDYEQLEWRKAFLIATSRFKWENLPESIPESYIEERLFWSRSMLGAINSSKYGISILDANYNGNINLYGLSPYALAMSLNGAISDTFNVYTGDDITTNKDIVLLRNNNIGKEGITTYELIKPYIFRLANNRRVKDCVLLALQNNQVIEANNKNEIDATKIRNGIFQHKSLWIINKKKVVSDDLLKPLLDQSAPDYLASLDNAYINDYREMLKVLGINVVSYEKDARLVSTEATTEQLEVVINLEQFKRPREIFIEQLNKRFGTNVKLTCNTEVLLSKLEEDTEVRYNKDIGGQDHEEEN